MIVVTGAAGFIGSNIVKALNKRGLNDIIAVDNLSNGQKFINLVDCQIADFIDKDDFIAQFIDNGSIDRCQVSTIFHQGACSKTTEWDGKLMMDKNYDYSKKLLHAAADRDIPFIYASSAAVYGIGNSSFCERPADERPANVYGYSKLLFDQYVRRLLPTTKNQIIGLRYFNVYGPGESHKDTMASVVYKHYQQIKSTDKVKLFVGNDGYGNGEQQRDFIYVDDIVDVNLWFFDHHQHRGIFNLGTGRAQTFNDIARAVIDWYGKGEIEYIPFPDHLREYYQSFTQADMSRLNQIYHKEHYLTVAQGVKRYLDALNN